MNPKVFFCTAMLALMGSLSPVLRAQSEAAPRSAPPATMHEKISGSQLVILPKSGHMTFVDQPRLFLAAVADFLPNPHAQPLKSK